MRLPEHQVFYKYEEGVFPRRVKIRYNIASTIQNAVGGY